MDRRAHLKISINIIEIIFIMEIIMVQGGGGGGWMEPLPGFFDVLLYFETILPSVENL